MRRPTLFTPFLRRAARAIAALVCVTAPARAQSRATADGASSLTSPGVSAALARWRAARVRDVRHTLTFDLTGRDTAVGHVAVRFTRVTPARRASTSGDDALLDWRGLRLASARANGRPVAVETDGEHVRVPAGWTAVRSAAPSGADPPPPARAHA